MARGIDRMAIFLDAEDYQRYLRLLAITVATFEWNLLAFCLMPNHVHLLIETTAPNLGEAMHWLHTQYAKTFNKRHARGGHRFEARYRAPLPVSDEGHLVQLIGYIAANPLKAKLVTRASDWPWSSHTLVATGRRPAWLAHDRLRDLLDEATGIDCYERIVASHERFVIDAAA